MMSMRKNDSSFDHALDATLIVKVPRTSDPKRLRPATLGPTTRRHSSCDIKAPVFWAMNSWVPTKTSLKSAGAAPRRPGRSGVQPEDLTGGLAGLVTPEVWPSVLALASASRFGLGLTPLQASRAALSARPRAYLCRSGGMADAADSKSAEATPREGSSPFSGTAELRREDESGEARDTS